MSEPVAIKIDTHELGPVVAVVTARRTSPLKRYDTAIVGTELVLRIEGEPTRPAVKAGQLGLHDHEYHWRVRMVSSTGEAWQLPRRESWHIRSNDYPQALQMSKAPNGLSSGSSAGGAGDARHRLAERVWRSVPAWIEMVNADSEAQHERAKLLAAWGTRQVYQAAAALVQVQAVGDTISRELACEVPLPALVSQILNSQRCLSPASEPALRELVLHLDAEASEL